MKDKGVIIGLLIIAALLPGCKGGGQQQAGTAGAPAGQKAGQGQQPYYYGLIQEYQTVLAEDPRNLAATIALGNAYYDAGQWKEAIRYYEQALTLDPHNADVISDMGTSFRNLGMPDRALLQYQKALEIEPGHQNALFNIGIVNAYDKKDYAAAIRVWERLLHVAPKHPKSDYMKTCMVNFKKALKREGGR
jgi:tetratricopeptide (TPR) repeat protein